MRKELGFLSVLALYALIAFSTGITLPPQPWRSYMGLLALQVTLLIYSESIARRISDPVLNLGLTGVQQRFANELEVQTNTIYFEMVVFVGTLFGHIAAFCCQDSQWSGPRTEVQQWAFWLTCLVEVLVGGGYLINNSQDDSKYQKALKNYRSSTLDEFALEAGPSIEESEETSALTGKSEEVTTS